MERSVSRKILANQAWQGATPMSGPSSTLPIQTLKTHVGVEYYEERLG
jgi:hypothetical protein